jgi:DNA polymerase III delta subunit
MIIFLHGPDEYRRLQKKKWIIEEFRKKHAGLAVGRFDLMEKEEFGRFAEFIGSQSMFDPKKLAILDNVFEDVGGEINKKELTATLKTAAKNPNTTVLVSEKNKSSEGLTFLAGKSANIEHQDFPYLTGPKWEAFVSELAKENGINLQLAAVKFLTEAYQNDTWSLATEIGKIAGLPKKNIGLKDLETLDIEINPDYFSLLKNLKNYELGARLASLEKLFLMNEAMPKIFNMIAYQLPDKLDRLAKYDVLVKSGKLEYEEVLVDLVI